MTRLIELAASPDAHNVGGRVLWGLRQGVEKDQQPRVAELALKVIAARSDESLRRAALDLLRDYGTATHTAPLKELLAKPGTTGEFREQLEATLKAIEARPADIQAVAAPTADKGANLAGNPTVLNIAADGSVVWDGKGVSFEELSERLKELAKHLPDAAIVLRAEQRTEYQAVVRVFNACRDAKLRNVAFATVVDPAAALVEKNRQAARARAEEDRKRYTWEELQEIEKLYQVANTKGKRSPEAVASLKQLLEKYDKANRTGCATLYLGQASLGAERLEYLTRAVEKFSDCYYFNGCQVGGYGRYVLALTLWEKGEKDKARALLAELKSTYKDATDHRGRPMSEVAEAAVRLALRFDDQVLVESDPIHANPGGGKPARPLSELLCDVRQQRLIRGCGVEGDEDFVIHGMDGSAGVSAAFAGLPAKRPRSREK